MFYENNRLAFIVKGVFIIDFAPSTAKEKGRNHSALSFRIKGNCEFHCNGTSYLVSSGSISYFPKEVDYDRITKSNEKLITIHFETFGEDEISLQTIENCQDLEHFFETIYEYWANNQYNKCVRTIYKLFDEIKKSSSAGLSSPPSVILAGVRYLEKNFRSPSFTIGDAARECHVSETYFRRLYTAHFGRSPIKALLDLRFNHAKSLLESGYYEIKEVASLSGCSDTKHFRTAFKKRVGITPNKYASRHSDK